MLTPVEQMLFLLLVLFALGSAYNGFMQMYLIINRGGGKLHLERLPQRLAKAAWVYLSQTTTLKTRRISSFFHLAIVIGFTYYFLVNGLDFLRGFFPTFEDTARDTGLLYDLYRLLGDVLSIAVLVGMSYFILRRFVLPNKRELKFHNNVLLHPKVAEGGVNRDSLIVGGFILLHVGSRFMGEVAHVAATEPDAWMPFATLLSPIFAGVTQDGLKVLQHIFFWLALGGIFVFLPYFAYSKHAHLFMAPLNFLTRPKRTSLGEMEALNFEDDTLEQFGAAKLTDLSKTQIFDGFACIMCNRCQDVCPAYTTGKELSPSALEINKRYYMRDHMSDLANPAYDPIEKLMGTVISPSAVWACTSCGACIDICPVGNEPMLDILDIRRDAVLMESEFPAELQGALKGMERQGNPWQSPESRFRWANGLEFPVPTVDENPNFDVLYWTGCAVSYDPRAQLTARALVKVLNTAGVNFAVLGEAENCTGDSARRMGKEDLYFEMASGNVETLNGYVANKSKRIVVTCPHCFHNIGKEYHQFGGDYEVVHHTELIEELMAAGKVPLEASTKRWSNVTFHDPCYLGRHNDVVDAPRNVLAQVTDTAIEMPRSKKNSFCCGAGGAQFWKEEEHGTKAVNIERYEEATNTGASVVAVGCPFCAQMFESAKANTGMGPEVKDIAELVADLIPAKAIAAVN